jgi:hypothetical protein
MQLKRIYAAVMLSAPLWLTGCLSGIPNPMSNPPPRERAEVAADNYEKYDAIPPARKTLLLNEGFDNNTRGWKVGSGTDYTMTIAAGEMSIGTASTARQNTISLTDLKETDNFELETRMQASSTNSTNGRNAFIWGASTSSWYFFRVDPYSEVVEIGRGTHASIDDTGYLRSGTYYVFTVRKVKQLYYYFINGNYAGKELANSFYGPAIGFEAGRNTSMSVDYLKVSRLNL